MVKHILGLSGEPDLIDELRPHQISNGWFNSQHCQQVEAEPRADYRCRAQCAFRFWPKPIDARGDSLLATLQAQSPPQRLRSTRMRRAPAQDTTFAQFAHDLLGEKRVPGGSVDNQRPDRCD